MEHIINLMSVIADVVGIRLVVPMVLATVVTALSCMIIAMHVSVRKYSKKKGTEYKPGYVNYHTMRSISHIDIDAYEQID